MNRTEVVYSVQIPESMVVDCSRRSFLKAASALSISTLTPTLVLGSMEGEAEAQWQRFLLQSLLVAGSVIIPFIVDKLTGKAKVSGATQVPALIAGSTPDTFVVAPNPTDRPISGALNVHVQEFNMPMQPGEKVADASRRALNSVKRFVASGQARAQVPPRTIQVLKIEAPVCSNVGVCSINIQGGQNWVETNPFHVVPPNRAGGR